MAKAGSSLPPIVLEPWTRRRVVAAWGIRGGGMLLEDGEEPLSWKKTQVAAPIIVFQIINFPSPWRNELASDGKILTHFLHNADNFTRILHIRFERFYD